MKFVHCLLVGFMLTACIHKSPSIEKGTAAAPFGVGWGQSESKVLSQYPDMNIDYGPESIIAIGTLENQPVAPVILPKNTLPVRYGFSKSHGLQSITVHMPVERPDDGSAGKTLYNDSVKSLTALYGAPETIEKLFPLDAGQKTPAPESVPFYDCLVYNTGGTSSVYTPSCKAGWIWQSKWNMPSGTAMAEILPHQIIVNVKNPEATPRAYVTLTLLGPDYSKMIEEIEKWGKANQKKAKPKITIKN